MVVTGVCSFYPQKRTTEKKRGRVFLKVIRTLVNAQRIWNQSQTRFDGRVCFLVSLEC